MDDLELQVPARVWRALAESRLPLDDLDVATWAARYRIVSPESGSPLPGQWSNEVAPYLIEVMQRLSPQDPARSVVLKKSHQTGGTEAGINLFGFVADRDPAPMLIVLPTIDEGLRYNRTKLQPNVNATPVLKEKVIEQRPREIGGSTSQFKKFVGGGFCQITGANSSAGLQMLSIKYLIGDEISEWPSEAGDRGDPLMLAEKRTTTYSDLGRKHFYLSTPGLKGMCRISERYEASDQRRYFVPCPRCGDYIVLEFDHLEPGNAAAPWRCRYACQSCGGLTEQHERTAMIAAGVWLPTFPEEAWPKVTAVAAEDLGKWRERDCAGREPGYHINQLYSRFVSWDDTYQSWKDAEGNPEREKVFAQQVLGLEWEEVGEAPSWETLMLRREDYQLGELPDGAIVLTGMADVQGDRLEYAVYGWGQGMSAWLVDVGVIDGDPARDETWSRLDEVMGKKYGGWPIEAFGIDAGYMSHQVYRFVRQRQRVFALDGRSGHMHPLIGTPKRQDVSWQGRKLGTVLLWPTGTWPLKSWIYGALRKTMEGPDHEGAWPGGAWHFPAAVGEEFFRQLTAEYLARVERSGRIVLEWRQVRGQANEQLDLAVGALAMAAHLQLDRYTPQKWAELAKQRGLEEVRAKVPAEMVEEEPQRPSAAGKAFRRASMMRGRRRTVSSLLS